MAATTATTAPAPVTTGAIVADLDTSGPANIAPATEFSPSGAPRQVTDVDVGHPAVDNDPRANTTALQNRIDFNDPSKSGAEAVAYQLGMNNEAEAGAEQARLAKKDQAKA